MKTTKLLLFFWIICILSTYTFAATCGNNNAEGSEQCDGQDLRDITCQTLSDYNSNWQDYMGGSLYCNSDCTFNMAGCNNNVCGDGQIIGLEECDDGNDNSDTLPDACRTDCVLPKCGDGVTDTGEDCDDGNDNSDEVPDACRTDCSYASCGDGVIDVAASEECDEGDINANEGCYQCIECYMPEDNLHISNSARLCGEYYYGVGPYTHTIGDSGEEGVIIIDGSDMVFDCDNVQLEGVSSTIVAQTQNSAATQQNVQANIMNQENEQEEESSGFFSVIVSAITNLFSDEPNEPEQQNPIGNSMGSEIKIGTGIIITGSNVVLANCDVTNYRTGVKITGSNNILANNKLCGNQKSIDSSTASNFGAKNKCGTTQNWQENGVNGCTYDCNNNLNTNSICPECVCNESQDCPVCEEIEEEIPEEPEVVEPQEVPVNYTCSDGTIVTDEDDCPEVEVQEVPVNYTCSDGTIVTDEDDCPEEETQEVPVNYTCSDGTIVTDEDDCPKEYKCSDGTIVYDEDDCPKEYKCSDGTVVYDEEDCPYDVCCAIKEKTGAISYYELTNKECTSKGGTETSNSYCDEEEKCSGKTPYLCPDGTCAISSKGCLSR